jgi:FixJ family two-component response regulator
MPFDLLLTDVVMPRVSGSDLASRVTRLHPGIAVLFMSGYADDGVVQENLAAHSISLVQKPFSASELLAEVQRVLDRRPINV